MDDSVIKQRIDSLNGLAADVLSGGSTKEKCFPTLLAVGIAAPIVVWLAFYFVKPSFVQKQEADGTYVRDNRKVVMYTFIVSLVVWACLYLWTYCKGYDGNAFTCFKK